MTTDSRWYQKSEMLVAMSALLVSFVAVVVAVYSAWIDRSFARASTWPYIEVFRSFDATSLEFGVANRGTGPALVRYAVLEHNGTAYATWGEWLDAEFKMPETGFTQSHISRRVLSPDQDLDVFVLKDAALAREIIRSGEISVTLCYCSVYDECWITGRDNQPNPIGSCDALPPKPFKQ
ncbi:MAG: hypothetical protein AAGL69_17440 [Pseudomonadota bacterium]